VEHVNEGVKKQSTGRVVVVHGGQMLENVVNRAGEAARNQVDDNNLRDGQWKDRIKRFCQRDPQVEGSWVPCVGHGYAVHVEG
jgi:hypothetical protein